MPLINIKVFEDRLRDDNFAERLTKALTEAVVEVCGEDARASTWVIVEGVPKSQWAFAGKRKP